MILFFCHIKEYGGFRCFYTNSTLKFTNNFIAFVIKQFCIFSWSDNINYLKKNLQWGTVLLWGTVRNFVFCLYVFSSAGWTCSGSFTFRLPCANSSHRTWICTWSEIFLDYPKPDFSKNTKFRLWNNCTSFSTTLFVCITMFLWFY